MNFPKSLKKALAIAGIASGLSSVSFAEDRRQGASLERPDAVVDVSKVPVKFDPQTGDNKKLIEPMMIGAAEKACQMKHLLPADYVAIEAVSDGKTYAGTIVPCSHAHYKAQQGSDKGR
jgi:hypothetical protein